MKSKKLNSIIGLLVLIISAPMFVFAVPASVSAAGSCDSSFLGLPTWHTYLEKDGECNIVGPRMGTGADEQFDWPKATGFVAVAVVEIMLRLASVIAVGYVMYGGFRFITSQGEPDAAKAARETILNALVGLVITLVAATIIGFIARRLT